MRPQSVLRARMAYAVLGALGLVITLVAGASAAAGSDPQGAPVQATVRAATVRTGQSVMVRGRVTSGEAGVPVALQVRAAGRPAWRSARTATTTGGGRFRLVARMWRSGAVRVVAAPPAPPGVAVAAATPPVEASAPRAVRVHARLIARHVRRDVAAGRAVTVAGALRPGGVGRAVVLQLRRNGRWHTVDRDRTARDGGFRLRRRLTTAASARARLRFPGDAANAAADRPLGRVNAYRRAYASWYGPGLYGNPLGCGGTLTPSTIGVANKSLPCGTRLTLRYHGHTVRAPVVDRGPYVAGREFDLTAATKARLHFGSTGWVQVTR